MKEELSFAELGRILGITRDGARKRVHKNADALEEYLIRNDFGKIEAFSFEGIDALKKLTNINKTSNVQKLESLKTENKHLKEVISIQSETIEAYKCSLSALDKYQQRVATQGNVAPLDKNYEEEIIK